MIRGSLCGWWEYCLPDNLAKVCVTSVIAQPFPRSKCGTIEYMRVTLTIPTTEDVMQLRVRRPVLLSGLRNNGINISSLRGIYIDYTAPIICNAGDGREPLVVRCSIPMLQVTRPRPAEARCWLTAPAPEALQWQSVPEGGRGDAA